MQEKVYHPDHYNRKDRKKCWDEMISIFVADAVVIFDCLNAYKYIYRAGTKDGEPEKQDLEKANNYIKHAINLVYGDESISKIAKEVFNIILMTMIL